LTVNASTSVELIGRSSDNRFPGGLFTQTQGTGEAGSVTVTTPVLRVLDGAEISAATVGIGNGGSVTINAADILRVQNGSQISVSSTGETASAGNLDITAGFVLLDGGRLTAQTLSGNGGNISLRIADVLLLRRGSEISTSAGTEFAGGDGGNITIDIPNGFIVAIPREDSDITADAFTGSGGRVEITAENLFGIQSRPFNTPESDITASSDFGIDGVVNINTPDVDPGRGIVTLSTDVIDPAQRVAQGCIAFDGAQGNQFTITGRGGLPASPDELLSSEVIWSDTRLSNITAQPHPSRTAKLPQPADAVSQIPATGWIFNNKGEVTLIAHTSTANNTSWLSTCHVR
jgi:large exoprotein involved in heme utilization and adhesion